MRPAGDWYIGTGYIRTRFHIRPFATGLFHDCCQVCVGPWLSPDLLTSDSRYHCRVLRREKCRSLAIRRRSLLLPSLSLTVFMRWSTILVAMIGLGQSSAIATYRSKANHMSRSHDENGSIRMNMYSLGVTDLDLSISPYVFGLRAFDKTKAVTRMLLGSSPCELRLMVPEDKLGKDGFHDVMIENLSGTPAWRSSYVSPAEVTSLRRQWPKAVFETL